ncbi:MAG: helix-turn-helix domain-containing protein [Clostridiales bacterium]|nr:helix-turn-helix domain-containing protein [Clostridiales bacterium]
MKLKTVIIEEDRAALQLLQKYIIAQSLECEIVGTAEDSETGVALARKKKPELLICAVKPEEESSLNWIARLKAILPECAVIVLAAEKNFDHALQAIRLGVCDYLLKPIQPKELESSIHRAVLHIHRTQEAQKELGQVDTLKRQAQLLALLTNDSQRGQGVNDMLEDAQLDFGAYYIMVVQMPGERAYTQETLNRLDAVFARKHARAVSILLYDSVVVFVRQDQADTGWRKEAAGLAQAVMEEMNTPVHISASQLHTSRHAIRQAYYQARQTLWEIALSKREQGIAFYQEGQGDQAPSERVAKTYRRINELIEQADLSDGFAVRAASVLVELSGHQYSNLRAMISLYTMALQKKFSMPPDRKTDAALYNTWFVSSENDARECLLKLSSALRELQETPKYSLLVKNTIQYINLHAIEGPQLGDVAEKMCVSANYLSALMRKETGITFHEHVLEAKMAVARSMLADPRVLVEEVARAVGYGNYISFYNAFKRVVHMTPTEFRNQMAGE